MLVDAFLMVGPELPTSDHTLIPVWFDLVFGEDAIGNIYKAFKIFHELYGIQPHHYRHQSIPSAFGGGDCSLVKRANILKSRLCIMVNELQSVRFVVEQGEVHQHYRLR